MKIMESITEVSRQYDVYGGSPIYNPICRIRPTYNGIYHTLIHDWGIIEIRLLARGFTARKI